MIILIDELLKEFIISLTIILESRNFRQHIYAIILIGKFT